MISRDLFFDISFEKIIVKLGLRQILENLDVTSKNNLVPLCNIASVFSYHERMFDMVGTNILPQHSTVCTVQ